MFPAWFEGAQRRSRVLPAGSQTTRQFLGGSTFTVPEGWVNDGDYAPVYTLFPDTPANEAEYALSRQTAQNILLTDKVPHNMFAICDATGLFQGVTASEVIDAVVANEALSDDRAGRRDDRWPERPTGRPSAQPQLGRQLRAQCGRPPDQGLPDARMDSSCSTPPPAAPSGSHRLALLVRLRGILADAMPIVENLQLDFAP